MHSVHDVWESSSYGKYNVTKSEIIVILHLQ